METASESDVAKLVTPADKIEKPAAKAADLIGDVPPVTEAGSPRVIDATDLLAGEVSSLDTSGEATPSLGEKSASDTIAANGSPGPSDGSGDGKVKRKYRRRRANFDDITAPEVVTDYNLLAGQVFDMSTGTAAMVLGNEWRARDEKEREAVVSTLAIYLKSKDVKDIPPGVMLTIVLLAYATPRLKEPETASKLKLGWQWMKVKVFPVIRNLFKRRNSKLLKLKTDHETTTASTN